ncbi:MAG: hypothetical protein ACREO1_14915 [Arenimonas sp.]
MKTLLASIAIFFFSSVAVAGSQPSTPSQVVKDFYSWEINVAKTGTQSEQNLVPVKKLLAPEFYQLLLKVYKVEQQCIKNAAKDEKPDMLDGNIFQREVEGASGFSTITQKLNGNTAVVQINLFYFGRNENKTYKWVDSVKLRKQKDAWLIVDIIHDNKRTVVGDLTEYSKVVCRPAVTQSK